MKRLNLGAGKKLLKGWENIDLYTDVAGIVKMDVCDLKYDDCSTDEILAQMVIEHLPRTKIVSVLKEWFRVLKPDGLITLATIDLDNTAKDWLDKDKTTPEGDYTYNLRGIYGQQCNEGNFHYTGFDFALLKKNLEEVGFDRIILRPTDHPHHLWVSARRPNDS